MNKLRGIATVFLLAVVILCVQGWQWADTLPDGKMEGARFALAMSGLATILCIALIWRIKPRHSA